MEFWVWGLGLRAEGLGFRLQDLGFRGLSLIFSHTNPRQTEILNSEPLRVPLHIEYGTYKTVEVRFWP
jgi:hypothetical protein